VQLPNEAACWHASLSNCTTLQKTVWNLIARGMIKIRHGKGTLVIQPRLTQRPTQRLTQPPAELSGFV
jgi:Transcriptional regulators